MTKVAFYINNESISNVDCTSILDSNPGIGGTEYLFYYTAYKLQYLFRKHFRYYVINLINMQTTKRL